MLYSFHCKNPGSKFLEIEFFVDNNTENEVFLQLPAWRPGRYELANFAKNIQKLEVKTLNNKPLQFEKITKDTWKVQTKKIEKFKVCYNYYANELNAGSTWVDEKQVYVNPVNCCIYVKDRAEEPIKLFLNELGFSETATSLQQIGDHFVANNFDELADSPFICSNTLQKGTYEVNNTQFYIWFQGECKPNWKKITRDFKAFTEEQLKVFETFPFKSYHFLNQILPHKAYHGVEHKNSTVISFGPGYSVFEEENYEEFLGVSSHELFHAWNVKSIRPADMVPYDFTKENYTKMGYLTEGVTTYYGDLILKRSGVFTTDQFLKQLNKTLDRHFWNYGARNLSVADSSFDTWLDGYERGIPNRKASIYTEGCLLALACDLAIRIESKNKSSLDTFMLTLYNKYYLKGKPLTEEKYKKELTKLGGESITKIIDDYLYGTKDYYALLAQLLKVFGFELKKETNTKYLAAHFGLFTLAGTNKILLLAPESPAEKSGLNVGDEIIAMNGIAIEKDTANEWAKYFGHNIDVVIKKDALVNTLKLIASSKSFFPKVSLKTTRNLTKKQQTNLIGWLN